VDARIPFSQSVACGPMMEMSPLLESRVVDGPALTRDATAGGSLGIKGDPCPVSRKMTVRNGRWMAIRIQIIALNSEHPSLLFNLLEAKVYLI